MENADYTAAANVLAERIAALIPGHPEIMDMDSPFDLFKLDGFECGDLEPSAMQAAWALAKAKKMATNSPEVENEK